MRIESLCMSAVRALSTVVFIHHGEGSGSVCIRAVLEGLDPRVPGHEAFPHNQRLTCGSVNAQA